MDIIEEVKKILNEAKGKKLVFVSGNFNILHPGHLRLLRFAADQGGYLVVGVNADSHLNLLKQDYRLENVMSISWVNHAFIMDVSAEDFIANLKPDVVVKGQEFEERFNPESEIVSSYGGKLVFGSGDVVFSSVDLLRKEFKDFGGGCLSKPSDYLARHLITEESLCDTVSKFKTLKVIVIGDIIVDEYIECDALGMSQEDPTIVVTPVLTRKFLGGAGIVSGHAKGLGSNVSFFSVAGNDENNKFVCSELDKWGVKPFIYADDTRTTSLKQRFRAGNKTLLRVNSLKSHHINKSIQKLMLNDLEKEMASANLLIFSDFSYGCLPQSLVRSVIELAKKNNVMMVADSQSSSQTGDISRFKEMDLITPTEREARLPLNDFESGLIILSEKLRQKTSSKHIFLTLGAEGVLIHSAREKELAGHDDWETDRLPALNSNPKDVSGAGDSLLTCSSLAMASGADIWKSAYLGMLAAACQVSRVGNIPLTEKELLNAINGNVKL